MQTVIISTGLGVVLFFIAFLGFRQGIRLGMKTAKGEMPEPIRSPAKVIRDNITEARGIVEDHEQVKAAKKFERDVQRLMSYTGDEEEVQDE